VTSWGRPASGRFDPNAARTTFSRSVAAFAGFAASAAVSVTVRGPSPATAGAAIVTRNAPVASACVVAVALPPIVTVASGVNVVPVTTICWPEAKHVPWIVRLAAAAGLAAKAARRAARTPARCNRVVVVRSAISRCTVKTIGRRGCDVCAAQPAGGSSSARSSSGAVTGRRHAKRSHT
jgi:hypothetical protein